MVLSESEFSHQALSDITPLRDIFGLLFFVTVGMLFDPRFAFENSTLVGLTVLAILLGKALIIGLSTRAFGYGNHAPWIVGLGLAQIGEFSFVLARAGLSGGFLGPKAYNLALTATVLTMAISPLVSTVALPLARRWRTWRGNGKAIPQVALTLHNLRGHVVIGGYGRTGRAAAKTLRAAGAQVVIVELNHSLFEDLTAAGFSGVWGDLTRPEILHAASIERAALLLLAMPDPDTVEMAMATARQSHPNLPVVARATTEAQVDPLRRAGALAVLPEFEGGVEMVRRAFTQLGFAPDEGDRHLEGMRQQLYADPH
jgi:CPA2 family monovalent cation:H+ antiporter-2